MDEKTMEPAAAETAGVFVFVADNNDPPIKAPLASMRSAAQTIEAQANNKIGDSPLNKRRPSMKPDEKQKPTKGILSTIWESMTKTGGCCGGGGNCCGAPPPSAGKPKTASQKNAPSSNSGK